MMTQKKAILMALQSGRKITALEALQDFGCFRLAARIHDIECDGWTVKRKMIQVNGRIAGKCTIAQYWIDNNNRQLELF